MYYYICGELVFRTVDAVAIDCGGVAYKLTVSSTTSAELSESIGTKVKLYTYMAVREDNIELFGFISNDELHVFKLLIGISGIGPKAAMSVLSVASPSKFMYYVCTEDIKALSKAPGVGAKTAARIVLELKDKIAKDFMSNEKDQKGLAIAGLTKEETAPKGKFSEATQALMALGYGKSEILEALRGIDTDKHSLEEVITMALKKFL